MSKINKHTAQYFTKIYSYRKLSEKEIHELYKKKSKNEVVKEITERNLQLAIYLVRAWQNNAQKYGIDYMDLVSAATIALLKATRNYNPKLGGYYKYVSSYVGSYLEAEIYKHLNYSRLYGKERIKNGFDVNPSDSLDKIISDNGEDEPLMLKDLIESPADKTEFIKIEVGNMLLQLEKSKNTVHPLASIILQLRYGIGKHRNNPLPLSSVAKILRLSKEGVRKIEIKALLYLRKL